MELKILNDIYMINNDKQTTEEIFKLINVTIEKSDLNFSHLVVDGVEVFDDFDDYLLDNLENIHQVEVVFLTVKQLINELILSTENYLTRAIPVIRELIDGFYQGASKETWDKLQQMFEGIEWLSVMITNIDKEKEKEKPNNWNEIIVIIANFQEKLEELAEGVENHDDVLVADVIQYEILPLFEAILNEIKVSVDQGGMRHDIS